MFPAGGDFEATKAQANIEKVRQCITKGAEKAGYEPKTAKIFSKGHGPRHIAPSFAARFNWTEATRKQFGMWAEGGTEVLWSPEIRQYVAIPRERKEVL